MIITELVMKKIFFYDIASKIKDNIYVHSILDGFHEQSWEHCKKGFFKFRE